MFVDGWMIVQSSVSYYFYEMVVCGKKLSFEMVCFIKFIVIEIFFGGCLLFIEMMVEYGEKVGFIVLELFLLCLYYIKMLWIWGDMLQFNKDKVIEVIFEEVYNCYMKYLCGCEYYFIDEMFDCSLVIYFKLGVVV